MTARLSGVGRATSAASGCGRRLVGCCLWAIRVTIGDVMCSYIFGASNFPPFSGVAVSFCLYLQQNFAGRQSHEFPISVS